MGSSEETVVRSLRRQSGRLVSLCPGYRPFITGTSIVTASSARGRKLAVTEVWKRGVPLLLSPKDHS